jgi:predicted CXXCH cytochrome family protein
MSQDDYEDLITEDQDDCGLEGSRLAYLIMCVKYYLFDKWRKDNCENCHGTRGGVRGNENIVDGKVLCDYCHADTMLDK